MAFCVSHHPTMNQTLVFPGNLLSARQREKNARHFIGWKLQSWDHVSCGLETERLVKVRCGRASRNRCLYECSSSFPENSLGIRSERIFCLAIRAMWYLQSSEIILAYVRRAKDEISRQLFPWEESRGPYVQARKTQVAPPTLKRNLTTNVMRKNDKTKFRP